MNRQLSIAAMLMFLVPHAVLAQGEAAEMQRMYDACRNSGGKAANNEQDWVNQHGCVCNGVGSGQSTCPGTSNSGASPSSGGDLATQSTRNVVQGVMNGNSQQAGMGLMGLGVLMIIQGIQGNPAADAERARAARQAEAEAAAERQRQAAELARRAEEIRGQLLGTTGAADSSSSLSLMGVGNSTELSLMTVDQTRPMTSQPPSPCSPSQDASVVDLCESGNVVDPHALKDSESSLGLLMPSAAIPISPSSAEIGNSPTSVESVRALATTEDKSSPYNPSEDGPLRDAPNSGGKTTPEFFGTTKSVPDSADVAGSTGAKIGDNVQALDQARAAAGSSITAAASSNNPAHELASSPFDIGGAKSGPVVVVNVTTPTAGIAATNGASSITDVVSWRVDQQRRINEINSEKYSSDAEEMKRRGDQIEKIKHEAPPPTLPAPDSPAPTKTIAPKPIKFGPPIVTPPLNNGGGS